MQNFLAHLRNDYTLVLIPGVCPLLIVATSLTNGFIAGGLFLLILLLSGLTVSIMNNLIPWQIRLPIILLILAIYVSLTDMLVATFFYEWHLTLNIYLPLLAVNCIILLHLEEYCLQHTLKEIVCINLLTGLSIWGILIIVGAFRQTLSTGWGGDQQNGLTIFALAPGAFLTLGFLVAILQFIANKINIKQQSTDPIEQNQT